MPFHSTKTSQCDEKSKRVNSVFKERKIIGFFNSHMYVQYLSKLCCKHFFRKTFFKIVDLFHTEILNILVEWIEEISVWID